MVSESEFRNALDEEPDNFAMYPVFADWLEEQGDWRAAGYRWMGESRHRPKEIDFRLTLESKKRIEYCWFNLDATGSRSYAPHRLPGYLFYLLGSVASWEPNLYYKTRKVAEEDLCKAVCKQMCFTIPLGEL